MDFSNNPIDKIEEVKEEEYTTETGKDEEIDPYKLIVKLQEKIILLEKENKDLKKEVESIKKKDILNSTIINKMSMVGLRRNFTLKKNVSVLKDDSVELAKIIKEKEELQMINNEILDMITKKELENDELNRQYENYILKTQMEKETFLEKIQNLEKEKNEIEIQKLKEIELYEENFKEYNKHKEQLKQEINEYNEITEDLKRQVNDKNIEIEKLKLEIQDLQFANLDLINKSYEQKKNKSSGVYGHRKT